MPSRYQDLRVYRLAREQARDLRIVARCWPLADQNQIGDQMIRAAQSIGANIAEAYGPGGIRERRRFLNIAARSAREVEHWISTAADANLADPTLLERCEEIQRMLAGLLRRPGKDLN